MDVACLARQSEAVAFLIANGVEGGTTEATKLAVQAFHDGVTFLPKLEQLNLVEPFGADISDDGQSKIPLSNQESARGR